MQAQTACIEQSVQTNCLGNSYVIILLWMPEQHCFSVYITLKHWKSVKRTRKRNNSNVHASTTNKCAEGATKKLKFMTSPCESKIGIQQNIALPLNIYIFNVLKLKEHAALMVNFKCIPMERENKFIQKWKQSRYRLQ